MEGYPKHLTHVKQLRQCYQILGTIVRMIGKQTNREVIAVLTGTTQKQDPTKHNVEMPA